MFRSLRSRLFFSYLVVIVTILFLVTLALLAVSVSQTARILPTLRQLGTIGTSVRRELAQVLDREGGLLAIREALDEVATVHDVRIVIFNRETGRLTYDSQQADTPWTADALRKVARPRGEFTKLDASLPIGRLRAADGSRWLVFSQPIGARNTGRLIILFARPEPTVLGFFRETFLRPLFLAGIIALVLSVLLAIWISRSVARPLQNMAAAAESISQGEYQQQLPLAGPEEVQRVASSFNSMAAQVATTQQAQRDFVANVSHDLKTPLTSIQGWSQSLLDGTAATSEQRERAAGVIHKEAERMSRLVEQLLDLARIESGQLQLAWEPVDLRQIAGEIHRNLALRAEEQQIQFTMAAQPVPPVPGDYDRLTQIVSNLVDNALAHTPSGGRVHLSLGPHGDKAVEIVVQDTGPGIPPEDLSRIFERFYQLEKSRVRSDGGRGSGLGLAIVKELVEAHGGRIIARSKVGAGSAFVVRLPSESTPEASTVTRRR